MNKILISACLLGFPVRYDGNSKPIQHPLISQWRQQGVLVSVCPEISGDLPTPRPAAEIQTDGRVLTQQNHDVSNAFKQGAQQALALCQQHNIKMAILKQSSPSCGSTLIYDGSFSQTKINGEGITCQLLRQHGIAVFDENTLEQAAVFFSNLN
jgi:uncharacterized protein YbbK (DUF523 family)